MFEETSARKNINVDLMFEKLVNQIAKSMKGSVPCFGGKSSLNEEERKSDD